MNNNKKSLAYLMIIKLKNDEVTIKVRGCTNGRKQRNWLSKEDTLLPTVSTKRLMLSCIIDPMEGRDVATSDIYRAFLQTDYEKGYIQIKMEGPIDTLLEDIDPGYYNNFTYIDNRGNKCMYAKAKKAIYGTLEASLIF